MARVPGRTASQWHKSKRGRPRNRESRGSCHREHPLWVPRHVRLDPVGRVPYRRPPPTARRPMGTRSTARRPRARARMERHRSRTARIRRPRTKGTPRTGRAPAHRQRPLDLSPPLSGTGPTAQWAASQAAGTPPNRSGTPPPLVGEAAVAPVPKTAPYSARAGGPRGAGNNQTNRMAFFTQRAVVFRSAEIASEKPSVPWGFCLSALRSLGRYLGPHPPLHRPISGPGGTTPAKVETAGARVGGAGSCPFDTAPWRACKTHPASQAHPPFLKHAQISNRPAHCREASPRPSPLCRGS